jgi:two-component system, OmpR family, phosphate regulon sensor histidine kinase PhoR
MKKIEIDKEVEVLEYLNDELENYFRNTIIPQLFVDSNLTLRKFTPPAMKHFNLSQTDIGKNLAQLQDNLRYSGIIDDINKVVETGEIIEKEIQTTDFSWYQMDIIPYKLRKENRTNGVIITFVDVTDRIKDIKELEKLNASHETFIYSVSHDLRAPLSNIEGLVSLFTNAEFNNEKINFAELLEKAVKTMKSIISELSEITKIEGNYKESIEKVHFDGIIKEVELILNDRIIESKAQITLEINEKSIEFSRKNIRSLIYNILSNAIKYKSPNRIPEISIKTERENDLIVLTLKDNGIGIAEDKIGDIFGKFSRIENKVEGSGIGLYLVKKIVDNHGGKIEVKSKVDEGTEFKVYLHSMGSQKKDSII